MGLALVQLGAAAQLHAPAAGGFQPGMGALGDQAALHVRDGGDDMDDELAATIAAFDSRSRGRDSCKIADPVPGKSRTIFPEYRDLRGTVSASDPMVDLYPR